MLFHESTHSSEKTYKGGHIFVSFYRLSKRIASLYNLLKVIQLVSCRIRSQNYRNVQLWVSKNFILCKLDSGVMKCPSLCHGPGIVKLWSFGSRSDLSEGFSRQMNCWEFLPWDTLQRSRKWQHTPESLPGKSHGQRRLAGYSPCSCKRVTNDSVTTYKKDTGDPFLLCTLHLWFHACPSHCLGPKFPRIESDLSQGQLTTLHNSQTLTSLCSLT